MSLPTNLQTVRERLEALDDALGHETEQRKALSQSLDRCANALATALVALGEWPDHQDTEIVRLTQQLKARLEAVRAFAAAWGQQ